MMKDFARIYIMGKEYQVPRHLTILQAIEHAGFLFVRGCGCRGGFCGACATVYRMRDSYKLKVALACQTKIEDGMYLAQIPFYPGNKAEHNIASLTPTTETLCMLYPEIMRCISCGSCSKVCPQDIKVMDYINAAIRGDYKKVVELSFDCIMCGLCATRCPAEIVHYYVALAARRIYGAHIMKKAPHLDKRLQEMKEKKFDPELEKLMRSSVEDLKKLYASRDIEP
ncbi:MAG: 4Fe-4S dicluster domain-containing protein [candidate division WOR-3 bacterium]|nr:4Fe-4S dicluster domain-containing protein [candidate division WOR-3 bacterium]MCX7757480.1 4Fe-4S dicluster domain-containing protein [candidate division WOR-3 bacterium]MDW7987141.1 4Fe-4S dicluster domain-containing protein [candidate division WOR-3 bacterium]